MWVYEFVYVCVCMYMCVCVCMYVCVCVCMCVCMFVCVCYTCSEKDLLCTSQRHLEMFVIMLPVFFFYFVLFLQCLPLTYDRYHTSTILHFT